MPAPKEMNYHHDFGNVLIGTTSKHEMVLHNETTVEQSYFVDFDQKATNYVSPNFFIEPMKSRLQPRKKLILKITYQPFVPFKTSRYYMIIHRTDGLCINLSLKGTSIGPKVESTTDMVMFKCITADQMERRCFYLINTGAAEAIFNFDIDNYGRLKIDPLHGTIKADSKTRCVLSYSPKYSKQHYFKLIRCYILHHAIIKIIVMNIPEKDKTKLDIDELLINPDTMSLQLDDDDGAVCNFSIQSPDTDNFETLVSFSERFINFDHCHVGKELKKSVIITNHCGVNITIIWEEDDSNVFKIRGHSQIDPLTSDTITVTFKPTVRDKIYFKDLSATIMWGQYLTSLSNSINLMGNSLENPACNWPAQYTVLPEFLNVESTCSKLKLPTSGPTGTPYSTFLIQRHGHLPLSFSLIHPLHTHFFLSPSQGLIRGPHQIFTAEMKIDDDKKIEYNKEIWRIQLNGGQSMHHLIIEGSREMPNLIINSSQPIYFPTTHPSCTQKYPVKIRNPTHNKIRYQVKEPREKCVHVDTNEYEIQSNEIITNIWSFSPPSPGYYEGEVVCIYYETDCTRYFNVTFVGECEPGHLMTEPKFFSLNSVTLGCWENEVFNVINDGECTMYIALSCRPGSLSIPSVIGEVYLEPQQMAIEPGASVEVKVCATPGGLFHQDMQIGYYVRQSEESNEASGEWTPLIKFDITGDYPSFQITDIRPKVLPFLTKYDLWKILEINRLNDLLKMMYLNREHEKTEIYLPSCLENSFTMVLEIMITNQSGVACDWSIIQEKTCDCELVEKQFGINIYKMVSVCQHKEQITLNPKGGILKEKGFLILTLKIIYELPSEQRQIFCLKINPEKMPWLSSFITITFIRYAIPPFSPMLWPYEPHGYDQNEITFKMFPVYIGQLKPFVQAFWLYNSSPEIIEYKVKPRWVQNSAFSCVNPTESIKPYSSHPVLFKFLPYELNPNKASFCLYSENKKINIIIEGESVDMFDETNGLQMRNKLPLTSCLPTKPFQLSTDHIIMSFVPLHSSKDEIFYLNNFSEYRLIMNWQRIKLRGILHLNVIPQREYVEPYQRILLKVTCKTSGQPCLITCNLICEIEKLKPQHFHSYKNEKKQLKQEAEEIEKELLGISVSIHANEPSLLEYNVEVEHKWGAEILQPLKKTEPDLIPRDRADIIVDVFNKVLWDIVSSKYFRHTIEKGFPPIFYEEFLQNETKKESTVRCPKDVTEHIFSNAISEILSKAFLAKT